MNVLDAIAQRRSIRAFKPDPVSRAQLDHILAAAQRAPSGTNTQPWHVYVCAGSVKQAITDAVLAEARSGGGRSYTDYDYYPAKWDDARNARRRAVGWGLYGLLSIGRDDHAGRTRQALRNFEFFGAPVGLFITTDAYLGRGSWADAGMYAQTIMLAAKAIGLDTCPQAAWVPYQETVLRLLGAPEGQVLVTGMSLGTADPDAIENTLVSEREDIANVVRYCGLE